MTGQSRETEQTIQDNISVTIQEADNTRKTVNTRSILLSLGIVGGITALFIWDNVRTQPERDARRKEREAQELAHIQGATSALESRVTALTQGKGDVLKIIINNGVNSSYDYRGDLEVTLGNCQGDIPILATKNESDNEYLWEREESAGEDNLLAIPDEFGNVIGYLPLTQANILASFPDTCTDS